MPVWDEIDDQTVTAGDDFSLTVEAKADSAVEIVYAPSGEYPDGMTIDSDGLIRWCPRRFLCRHDGRIKDDHDQSRLERHYWTERRFRRLQRQREDELQDYRP